MSRGPGRLQQMAMAYLDANTCPVTLETLRWSLLENPDDQARDLRTAWNTSICRAIEGLEKENRISIEERRLISFEECAREFPGKTTKGNVRKIRLGLLPVLLDWYQTEQPLPHYNRADNEKYHLRFLSKVEQLALRRKWEELELKLVSMLSLPDRKDRNALFQLIAKAKSIFETEKLRCDNSFAEHVAICLDRRIFPKEVAQEVVNLSDAIVPPSEANFLRFKSYIHGLVNIPRKGSCWLKEDTVARLEVKRMDFLAALPEFVPASRDGYFAREAKHSPELNRLFDQTVFQKFRFISIM